MKKLLLGVLLLFSVLAFSGCAAESAFNTEGALFGGKHFTNEKAYYKIHLKKAAKVYKLCEMNIGYYNANSDGCNIVYYALKNAGKLKSYKN